MKLEEQVLSIEQMNHLKELGVEVKDASFAWCIAYKDVLGNLLKEPVRTLLIEPPADKELDKYEGWATIIPTLTLQEILEMLPGEIKRGNDRIFLIVNKADRSISYMSKDYHGRLDSVCITADGGEIFLTDAYYMLCWVLEYGYLNASNSMQ